MDKEESIDLRELLQIVMQYKKVLFGIVAACTALAMITAFFILPKTYESTTLVRAKAPGGAGLSAAAGAMAALGVGGGASSPTMVYTEMMKSRTVIEPLIEKVDLPEEDKEKLLVKDFVKKYLDIKNTKGTDLIEITATSKDPEEAQMIAGGVVDNFLTLMTQLNQNEQSSLMKFLTDRIEVSKKEMEDAENKLEEFSQKEKIYVPDEQAKALIEKVGGYDKVLSELKAGAESNRAQFNNVTAQLNQQKVALREFNMTDNESIQKIKESIINKQIQLIEAQQKYTDKHPNVVLLKDEIEALNRQLSDEVDRSVASETNTLNPIQAGLLKTRVETETALVVNQARQTAVQEILTKAEEEISKLSTASMQYIRLSRDVKIAQGVYSTLINNFEQARIKEAMESMDIQIVDPADLAKKPAGPRKLLITAIGGVLGLMIAFGYTLLLYNKNTKQTV